jgi:demethylmenaquinone methyltransferase/2-methoxy-6-polyprenyl-1,4-benzoquinol methylase
MKTPEMSRSSKFKIAVFQKMLTGLNHPRRNRYHNPDRLVRASGIEPGQTVLEVGCGSGFFTEAAAAAVGACGRLHAIDIHPLAVEKTARRIQATNTGNAFVTCADAHATDFMPAMFDTVLLFGVIPAPGIINTEKLIWEIHRILRPGGKLAAWTMVPFWSPNSILKTRCFSYSGKQDKVHRFSRQEVL